MIFGNKKYKNFREDFIKSNQEESGDVDEGKIFEIIKSIENSKTSDNFFDCTYELSVFFEKLTDEEINKIYQKTNVYVLVLSAVLNNTTFINTLGKLVAKEEKIHKLTEDENNFNDLVLINTAIRLAFFPIAINHKIITKNSIEYLRKNITNNLKNILKQNYFEKSNLVNLCFFLEKVSWDKNLHYQKTFATKPDTDFLFSNLMASRSFSGISFLSLVISQVVENNFKKIIFELNNNEAYKIGKALDSIHVTVHHLNKSIKHYYKYSKKDISDFFDIFIRKNEISLIFILEIVCSNFHYQEDKNFFDIVLEKIKNAANTKKAIEEYVENNFAAFRNDSISDIDNEWTNKIFLISIKTFSILQTLSKAKDKSWAANVAIHELNTWAQDVHEVLNKYYIEDDWDKVKELVSQESERVEWKSSFFTPLEQNFKDKDTEISIGKKLFEKILKVVLAMINTDGGCLIVGMIENPDAIRNEKVKDLTLKKNGVTFFNIGKELEKRNKSIDSVRLQLLNGLTLITDCTQERFNNLIEFEEIFLKNDDKIISIVKITVKKSEKLFFNVKKEGSGGNLVWVSLTKRAQGQNVDVDIREYL